MAQKGRGKFTGEAGGRRQGFRGRGRSEGRGRKGTEKEGDVIDALGLRYSWYSWYSCCRVFRGG